MATILKGAPVVAAMNERNAALCEQLKTKGITPTLAVVRVGEREDDLSYERGVIARCGKVGVEVKQFLLPADASQDDLLKVIAEVNAEDTIHGCLLFRPLPRQFNDRTVRAALDALRPGGVLAAVLYSGKVIGDAEKQAALAFFRTLPLTKYTVLVCEFANWADTAPLPCFVIKK